MFRDISISFHVSKNFFFLPLGFMVWPTINRANYKGVIKERMHYMEVSLKLFNLSLDIVVKTPKSRWVTVVK